MKYFLSFLMLISIAPLSSAGVISGSEELPIYVGIKFGSGSSALTSVSPPVANVVTTDLDDDLTSKGILVGARIAEFNSSGIYLSVELSSSDLGEISIFTTTTTSNFFATQSIKVTDIELIFGKTIRENVALRVGFGVFFPKVSVNTDIVNLQPSNPSLVAADSNESGQLFSIGVEVSVIDEMSVIASYSKYPDIGYSFDMGLYEKTDLSVFSIGVVYLF